MTEPTGAAERGVIISRRHFVVGAVLAGASAATYAAQPQPHFKPIDKQKFVDWIPEKVGPWSSISASGVVLPPPDALSARLYDNLVTRVYGGVDLPPVMMCLAYNYRQDGVLQLHRPEICYPAGGYRLSPTIPVALTLGPGHEIDANAFSAAGPERIEQVLYWTRVDNSFPRSWLDQRITVMKANLRGIIPDGTLMRVSVADNDQQRSLEVLRRFLSTFLQVSPPPLQRVLAGNLG